MTVQMSWLAALHRTARPIVPRPCGSRSSPAPAAHRFAAAGLDRDTYGRELALVPSMTRSVRRCGRAWGVVVAPDLGACQEARQLAAGCVEGALLGFGLSMGE